MDKRAKQLKKIWREDDTRVIEIEGLGKKTLTELKIEIAQALYDEFKDDPEYQWRFSQITEHLDNSNMKKEG